jgi:hypothetical protein
MKRKRIKCEKCGIYFRERNWEEPAIHNKLCFNCSFIWKAIGSAVVGLGFVLQERGIKREIEISLDDIKITKVNLIK